MIKRNQHLDWMNSSAVEYLENQGRNQLINELHWQMLWTRVA